MRLEKASTTAIAGPAPLRSHQDPVCEPCTSRRHFVPPPLSRARDYPAGKVGRDTGTSGAHIDRDRAQRAEFRYWECGFRAQPALRDGLLDQSAADGEQVDTEPPTDGAPDPTLQQQCHHDRDHAHRDEVERLVILELV